MNFSGAADADLEFDKQMTHVSTRDIDAVLSMAPQPVSFWVELGVFEGGSVIQTAKQAKLRDASLGNAGAPSITIVAVDTFLGDVRTLWERPKERRRELLRADGTISLYERFRANVRRAGHEDVVLPLPATSVVALRLIPALASRGVVPYPQVIYLDSAHEEGEVLLELQLAWKAIAPGGILFGDDWVLPAGRMSNGEMASEEDNMVQRDVLRFAEAHQAELDDDVGQKAHPTRTLGRPRPGLFVSYQSFQWFMQKRSDVDVSTMDSKAGVTKPSSAAFDCWSDGFEKGDCCDEQAHGPGGNLKCWDLVFTFEQCC